MSATEAQPNTPAGGTRTCAPGPGETVRVPAGTPHAYEIAEPARYLTVMTPKIRELIARLHQPDETDWRDYESELL
jgi:hypothetical protein